MEKLKELRHKIYEDEWTEKLSEIIKNISRYDRSKWFSNSVDVVRLPGRKEILVARGKISEHIDDDFPEWAYIYVAEAGKSSFFHVRGKDKLHLKAGMLVEFRAHTRHRLEQPQGSDMIWVPFDSPEIIDLDHAYTCMKERYSLED